MSDDVRYLRDFRKRPNERDGGVPSLPPRGRGRKGRFGDEASERAGSGSAGVTETYDRAGRGSRGSRARTARPGAVPSHERTGGDDSTLLRRLAAPQPVVVQAGDRGVPARVGTLPVEAMLEDWVVEDRWWTGRPLRRRYFELVLVDGRNVVVFHDLVAGRWFAQRA